MTSYNRRIFAGIIFMLAAATLSGVVFTALLREKIPAGVLAQIKNTRRKYEQKLAAEWLQAVEKDDPRKALYAASLLIVPEEPLPLPAADALKFSKQEGLLPLFLSPSFSTIDYFRWRDAWMLKHAAALITKTPFPVEEILRFALAVKAAPSAAGRLSSLLENGCPDIYARARLFCGLAEQAGFDAKIVLLTDAQGAPAYILAAVSKEQRHWIADLPGRRIYKDSDISSFMPPDDWPDELKNAFFRPKLMLQPSEFQDFRPANQVLNNKLRKLVPAGNIPVFGRDPEMLLAEFLKNRLYGNPDKYYYWDESFSAVKHLPETGKWMIDRLPVRRNAPLQPEKKTAQ
jgi:hypothetical protein